MAEIRENETKIIKADDCWIGTYSGVPFRLDNPRPEDVRIEDIAHSLSLQCRFNGHCDEFYSVAEHCVEVSNRVSPSNALDGLLHDAAEAYVGDVTGPLKQRLLFETKDRAMDGVTAFRHQERRVNDAIRTNIGLPMGWPVEVDKADLRMLATERRQLFGPEQPEWGCVAGVVPYDTVLNCWTPKRAEEAYLERFSELYKGVGAMPWA